MSSPPGPSPAARLLDTLAPARELLILTHDNPDPDCLASALGLQTLIADRLGAPAAIAAGGIVGRAENRAMASELEIELLPAEKVLPEFGGSVILVDTQPERANNALPSGRRPIAVIDHHPDWGASDGVPFADLREHYGATSTIVVEYLRELGIEPTPALATALFYAIASETQQLARSAIPADVACSQYLYPLVDTRVLGAIETPDLGVRYFELIGETVDSALRWGDLVISVLDEVPYPDAVAELADLLLRVESATWACCLAPFEGLLYVSIRSRDPDARAGRLLASILPDGSAGGHDRVAGGRTPLGPRPDEEVTDLALKLLAALGRDSAGPAWLTARGRARVSRSAARLFQQLSR